MTPANPLERIVEDWLSSAAPATIPADLHAQIVGAARRTRQGGPVFGFAGGRTLLSFARLAVDLAAVAVLVVAAVNLLPGRGSGGTVVTATPFGTSPQATERVRPSAIPDDPFWAGYVVGVRQSVNVDGIPFSFIVPAYSWESYGEFMISKSIAGPQGAEAVVFWAGFPDGLEADPCANLTDPPIGAGLDGIAAAVANAAGVELVSPPRDVIVGGHVAKRVAVTIREDLGCDPGYFYNWKAQTGGALWTDAVSGDTIRVWVVDTDGGVLFIGALANQDATPSLEQEIEEIVGSMQFE
jgi:hypothetical protein